MFRHDDSGQIEECREFMNGRCSRGDACRFKHVGEGGGPPPPPQRSAFDDEEEERGRRRYDDDDDDKRNEDSPPPRDEVAMDNTED
mmetsp:Transcript_11516/g.36863  ORF Transcript_11516/g.36863 Transcript_11516/m.36863 type:complete len:86 (+) Transcript_11516:1-258(+)